MLPFTLDGAEFQTVVHQILIGCHLDRHPQEDDPHPHHQDDDPHLKVQTSIENSQAVTRSDSWICTNHCQQKIKICWVFGNYIFPLSLFYLVKNNMLKMAKYANINKKQINVSFHRIF